MEEIEEHICSMVSEILGKPSQRIGRNTPLEKAGLDSVQRLEMVMTLEELFDVEISDEEGEAFLTIADVIVCVAEKKNGINIAETIETPEPIV